MDLTQCQSRCFICAPKQWLPLFGRQLVPLVALCLSFFCLILSGCVKDEQDDLNLNESLTTASTGASLRMSLVRESDGAATTSVTPSAPGTIIATVLDSNDDPVASQIVTFTSDVGQLSTNAGTALTGATGQATIGLSAGTIAGVGTITAVITLPTGETLQGSLNYTVNEVDSSAAPIVEAPVISLSLTSADATANTIRVDAPGTLTITVTDGATPLANQLVTIVASLSETNPTNGVVLTNSEGVATLTLTPSGTTGADIITATLDFGEAEIVGRLGYNISPPNILFGSGSGTSFVDGTLALGLSTLAAGGTTLITATIVDDSNALVSQSYDVTFTSECVEDDLAEIDTTITASNGTAIATYRANGCVGTDTIRASLLVGTTQFDAEADVTILSDAAGTLQYVSVTPNVIALQGAGGQGLPETASVTFRLLGQQGLPIANQTINFTLTTTVGNITLLTNSAITNALGEASAIVQSGTIATSVGVIATLDGTQLSSQSEQLNVTTGVPDQDSMTVRPEIANPEAWDYFGEQVAITARLADVFNNPAPDGTAVSFTSEGGQIEGSCITTAGSCQVTWTSQNPRPEADLNTTRAGRVTISATAIGAESFFDEDGDGVFSDGDQVIDLPEAFRDDNEDDLRTELSDPDPAEPYIDFNTNGQFDIADGLYSGPLCSHATLCAPQNKLTVRDDFVLVMSTSSLDITFSLDSNFTTLLTTALDVTTNNTVFVRVADSNGNAPPYETTITTEVTNGELDLGADLTVQSRTEPITFPIRIVPDEDASTGSLIISAETPKGNISSGTLAIID